jgi:hypothetical protein
LRFYAIFYVFFLIHSQYKLAIKQYKKNYFLTLFFDKNNQNKVRKIPFILDNPLINIAFG